MKYNNGTKKMARNWCWNQIERRIARKGTVMVLIGDTNYELDEGRERGFNVIGVDIKEANVRRFRRSGGVAVCDDVVSQMSNVRPDAVIFDGLSGITGNSLWFVEFAAMCTKAVVWNGLRGRDPIGASLRNDLAESDIMVFQKGRYADTRQAGIHRAMLLFSYSLDLQISELCECGMADNIVKQFIETNYGTRLECVKEMKVEYKFAFASQLLRKPMNLSSAPEFMTYRSKDSGQYFDTGAWSVDEITRIRAKWIGDVYKTGGVNSARKAAAVKALMTMGYGRN